MIQSLVEQPTEYGSKPKLGLSNGVVLGDGVLKEEELCDHEPQDDLEGTGGPGIP